MDDPSTGQGVVVRPAERDDVDALVTLRAEMFLAIGAAGAEEPGWRRAARDWFLVHVDDPAVCIAVVEEEGAVVSVAIGVREDGIPSPGGDGSRVHLSNVSTLPHARHRGHARRAVASVLEWADGQAVARTELFATEEGRPLYASFGFRVHPFPSMRRPRP
ncbi:GNAT family N-acetyltransferase [Microbacterium resistens]|uniref:GNAT family N-acetyltransferase n=1 Tax=Microbacterium resistens TaxID=156977 RepID=UPI00082EA4F2|nr:GNAT family N-acetyltransferase [Microbacterium resistens]